MSQVPAHDQPIDPIRERRARIEKWALLANRVGYLFVALAMALFFIAFAVGFSSTMVTSIIVTFLIGCALLAPSIIIGYAVRAAERDGRDAVLLRVQRRGQPAIYLPIRLSRD